MPTRKQRSLPKPHPQGRVFSCAGLLISLLAVGACAGPTPLEQLDAPRGGGKADGLANYDVRLATKPWDGSYIPARSIVDAYTDVVEARRETHYETPGSYIHFLAEDKRIRFRSDWNIDIRAEWGTVLAIEYRVSDEAGEDPVPWVRWEPEEYPFVNYIRFDGRATRRAIHACWLKFYGPRLNESTDAGYQTSGYPPDLWHAVDAQQQLEIRVIALPQRAHDWSSLPVYADDDQHRLAWSWYHGGDDLKSEQNCWLYYEQ